MREKKNRDQRGILEIVLMILAPIVAGVVSHHLGKLPLSDTVVFCALSFLVVLEIHQHFQLREIRNHVDGTVKLISLFIDAFTGIDEKLLQLPKAKRIVAKDLVSVFAQPLHKLFQDASRAFIETILKPSSPEEHEEIRRLMEKANRGIISRKEAERLKTLLEKEKRKRENVGDILGAIIVGLLLLFVLGLLASLFLREE